MLRTICVFACALSALSTGVEAGCRSSRSGEYLVCSGGGSIIREFAQLKKGRGIFVHEVDIVGEIPFKLSETLLLSVFQNLEAVNITATGQCITVQQITTVHQGAECFNETLSTVSVTNPKITVSVTNPEINITNATLQPVTDDAYSASTPTPRLTTTTYMAPLDGLPVSHQVIISVVVSVIITTSFVMVCLWLLRCLSCNNLRRCPQKRSTRDGNHNLEMKYVQPIAVETLSMNSEDSVDVWTRPTLVGRRNKKE